MGLSPVEPRQTTQLALLWNGIPAEREASHIAGKTYVAQFAQ